MFGWKVEKFHWFVQYGSLVIAISLGSSDLMFNPTLGFRWVYKRPGVDHYQYFHFEFIFRYIQRIIPWKTYWIADGTAYWTWTLHLNYYLAIIFNNGKPLLADFLLALILQTHILTNNCKFKVYFFRSYMVRMSTFYQCYVVYST